MTNYSWIVILGSVLAVALAAADFFRSVHRASRKQDYWAYGTETCRLRDLHGLISIEYTG